MKKPAYLFGPFVGEMSWEFYRFAPYAIHIKKEHLNIPIIVFTRPERFDLYGEYADILVPLRIPNDVNLKKEYFTIESLLVKDYNRIARTFASTYKRRFQIIDHFYPDISTWRYKLKWQFPRRLMDYEFRPRRKNKQIARSLVKANNFIVDNSIVDPTDIPEGINSNLLLTHISDRINNYDTTSLGCMIDALKLCRFVVGNFNSYLSHLAILLNKPLVCINNNLSLDEINLLNPLKTPIVFDENIKRGIEKYENTI
jgi:hypothetical protein